MSSTTNRRITCAPASLFAHGYRCLWESKIYQQWGCVFRRQGRNRKSRFLGEGLAACLAALVLGGGGVSTARSETILHTFTGGSDGATPFAGLIVGSDGNLYGTTLNGGGKCGCGTVFKVTPSGTETVLYSFQGGGGDGAGPAAPLIQGSDGNFYGTTYWGGGSGSGCGGIGCGTIFRVTPEGVETVLYSFKGGSDGASPWLAGLTLGSDGNFYGTTFFGGGSGCSGTFGIDQFGSGCGTVFKVTPGGVESVIYSFKGGSDGASPRAGLALGSDGVFYGTTVAGGGKCGCGTVFKVAPEGVESVLYSFKGGSDGQVGAGLVLGSDGNFYGTTLGGGTSYWGTVFKITPSGTETVLYSFKGGSDGASPWVPLLPGLYLGEVAFFGTTLLGGKYGHGINGTVFRITPSGVETVLHSFKGGSDGGMPYSSLVAGTAGDIYGTTSGGESSSKGTVFKLAAGDVCFFLCKGPYPIPLAVRRRH
jgi:uncharacterized repeat protein (TIGR03803 family)